MCCLTQFSSQAGDLIHYRHSDWKNLRSSCCQLQVGATTLNVGHRKWLHISILIRNCIVICDLCCTFNFNKVPSLETRRCHIFIRRPISLQVLTCSYTGLELVLPMLGGVRVALRSVPASCSTSCRAHTCSAWLREACLQGQAVGCRLYSVSCLLWQESGWCEYHTCFTRG